MTTSTEQRHDEWGELANRLSADHPGHDVTIEVLDVEGGDSSLVQRLPFQSMTYDHRDDVVVISVGGRRPGYPVVLRHVIRKPREILVDRITQGTAIKITDSSGTTTLVSLLRRPDHPGA